MGRVQFYLDWLSKPVMFNSPRASRVTQVYRELMDFGIAEVLSRLKKVPLPLRNLLTVESHQTHFAIVNRLTQAVQWVSS